MKSYYWLAAGILTLSSLGAVEKTLPEEMQKVLSQPKYDHAIWGIYAKDLQTGEVLFDQNSNKLFSPASTTKLFSTAALLHAYGDDYRFKTPVYATGKIDNGILYGDLVLVAQGDLTFGGRETDENTIAYTKMDHIIANNVPGVILTKQDPLTALNDLAKQVAKKGIKEIRGDVVIDDSLFDIVEKRDMFITPIMINENLIDLEFNPAEVGKPATLFWRPQIPGYQVDNQVKTVAKGEKLDITVTADESGKNIVVKGTIPEDQKNVVRTSTIEDPAAFAHTAFVKALEDNGIKIVASQNRSTDIKTLKSYKDPQKIAQWTSPPITEYAKLILKVSHNLGANLIPLLLAVKEGKKSFDEGMKLIGDFTEKEVKINRESFVFIDGAGGNENRLTLDAEVKLLEYINKLPHAQFQHYYDALPILGVDGSLEDFGTKSSAAGKVRAKPGTGVAYNLSAGNFLLITQALAGYIEGKNGHLYAYIVVVNNGNMTSIDDVFAMFADDSTLSSIIYDHTDDSEGATDKSTLKQAEAPSSSY